MYRRTSYGWAKHLDFILLDTLCLQIAFLLAYYYRFGSFGVYGRRSAYRTSGLVLLFLSIFVAIFFNTMHNVLRRSVWEEIKNTIIQCGLVFAAIVVLLFTSKDSDHVSRIVMYMTVSLYVIFSFVTRLVYKKVVIAHKKSARNRGMLLVGDKEGIKQALEAFEAHPEAGIDVRGLVLLDSNETESAIKGFSIVTDPQNAGEYIRNEWIDEVYIAVKDFSLLPEELLTQCDEMGVTIHQQMFVGRDIRGKQWVEKIAKQPVLTTSISIPEPREIMLKRASDIVAGALMSIAAGVILLIVAPSIKKSSPGPILLKQERIGLNGKKFRMFSIRTMYMDADKRLKAWKENHENEKLTAKTDPRIIGNVDEKTGVGFFLRHWGLDELPKGFNVFLGSMSLVGTRAPSVSEWENYEFRHRARLSCKPGITGLWQASGRSKTMTFEEATALDTEYIANWSIGLDLKILLKTIGVENRQA